MVGEEQGTKKQQATGTASINYFELMRSRLKEVSAMDMRRLGITGGLKVTAHITGKLAERTNMCQGFVITAVDHKGVYTLEDFANAIENKAGVMLEGVYPDGYADRYYLELS